MPVVCSLCRKLTGLLLLPLCWQKSAANVKGLDEKLGGNKTYSKQSWENNGQICLIPFSSLPPAARLFSLFSALKLARSMTQKPTSINVKTVSPKVPVRLKIKKKKSRPTDCVFCILCRRGGIVLLRPERAAARQHRRPHERGQAARPALLSRHTLYPASLLSAPLYRWVWYTHTYMHARTCMDLVYVALFVWTWAGLLTADSHIASEPRRCRWWWFAHIWEGENKVQCQCCSRSRKKTSGRWEETFSWNNKW